jgi:4-hydroxy-4-methyl-2-oxoglutarate aldolase
VSPTLLQDLAAVSYPTIGHFLEDGFVSPAIQSLLENVKIAGPAVTVRIDDHNAIALNHALLALRPGDVLVVDMGGDHQHAPVGAVTAAAALAQGAAGVVVDGVATDVLELRQTVLGKALESDAAEPAILARIASGEPLESILAL